MFHLQCSAYLAFRSNQYFALSLLPPFASSANKLQRHHQYIMTPIADIWLKLKPFI